MVRYSGCSSHMIGDQTKFLTLKKENEGSVTFGGNTTSRIDGKGTLSLDNGKTKIENVLYVEDLKHNLLNVSQMCDQVQTLTFNSQVCEIRKVGLERLVAKSIRTSSNIYDLNEIKG